MQGLSVPPSLLKTILCLSPVIEFAYGELKTTPRLKNGVFAAY